MSVELLLRVLHILAAAALIGGVIFNYFLLRPALRFVPPAPAVVIGQRVGTAFTWLGWITLVILGLSGGLRLIVRNQFWLLFTPWEWSSNAGWALTIMFIAWLVTVGSAAWMTVILRPVLMSKLTVQSNPDLAAAEKRRAGQMAASLWLDRLQLVNVVFTILAALAGSSVMYGGWLF